MDLMYMHTSGGELYIYAFWSRVTYFAVPGELWSVASFFFQEEERNHVTDHAPRAFLAVASVPSTTNTAIPVKLIPRGDLIPGNMN